MLAATRQVAQAGTAAQVKGAQDVLRTARKGIYRLLADDERPRRTNDGVDAYAPPSCVAANEIGDRDASYS